MVIETETKRWMLNVDMTVEVWATNEEEARDRAYDALEAAIKHYLKQPHHLIVAQPIGVIWGPEEVITVD